MIKIESLTLQRGALRLLENADLTLHPGQKAGLLGTNGAGKSSLFALFRGELTPDAGSLLEPALQIAHFPDQVGFPFVIHESDPPNAGEAASVEYIMTAYVDGEIAAYVQHFPNEFGANPVGGANYGYTLTVEEITPTTPPGRVRARDLRMKWLCIECPAALFRGSCSEFLEKGTLPTAASKAPPGIRVSAKDSVRIVASG